MKTGIFDGIFPAKEEEVTDFGPKSLPHTLK